MRYASGPLAFGVRPALRLFRRVAHRAAGRWLHRRVVPDAYLRFADEARPAGTIGEEIPLEDGHPSFRPGDSRWMLLDTYPDPAGRQNLMVYDLEQRRAVALGWFATPAAYRATGYRCDLHPRWSRCGERVVIDSLHEGARQMFVYDVRKALEATA